MYAWPLVIQMKILLFTVEAVVSIEDTCENKRNKVHTH